MLEEIGLLEETRPVFITEGNEVKVLVIEDDPKISLLIRQGLEESNYLVEEAGDGLQGQTKALNGLYDLLIIDLMLPHLGGLELILKLREAQINTPVLIISAKHSVDERVAGLKVGGDDYLVKPFAMTELLARVEALLRRTANKPETGRLSANGVTMDLLTRETWRDGIKIDLQAKEFSLLEYFLRNPGKVLTKNQILKKIWGYDFDPQTNVVDVLVWRLRSKIDKEFQKKLIQTSRGIGYVLEIS